MMMFKTTMFLCTIYTTRGTSNLMRNATIYHGNKMNDCGRVVYDNLDDDEKEVYNKVEKIEVMEGRRALIEDVIFYVIFGVMDFCFNVHAQNQVEDMAQLFCTNQAGIYEGIYDKLAELDHPVTMGTTTVYVAGKKEFMGTCSNA